MLDKKKFYINGKWVEAVNKNECEVINPSTEEVCAIISRGSSDDKMLQSKQQNLHLRHGKKLQKKKG